MKNQARPYQPARRVRILAAALIIGGSFASRAADTGQASVAKWIEAQGGEVVRGSDGRIVEVSLARTWATDNDIERVIELKGLKRLDLSFTYVTDKGIERIQQLQELEELNLDTAEFITDAATSYLRANRRLRKLNLRGTDVTDISLPHIVELTSLRNLDLSFTQLGDVGIESLPALTELEDLNVGGTRISGLNLNILKLLPKLKRLNFNGIQRRNAGACWSPQIGDLDLDTISQLTNVEDLNVGIGLSLGKGPMPTGAGNCRVAGGIKITDLGLAKIARMKKLKRLDVSGAKITPAGIKILHDLPQLERLSVWNCTNLDDSAAPVWPAMPNLTNLDLSDTPVSDATLEALVQLPKLKLLYLTDTKVTPAAVEVFRKQKPATFVSFARRPAPASSPAPSSKGAAK